MSTGLYRFLKELSAGPATLIATVIAVNPDNTSTVQFPDGSQQSARGTSVAVGSPAFVRNGVIEGVAPARVATVIEI